MTTRAAPLSQTYTSVRTSLGATPAAAALPETPAVANPQHPYCAPLLRVCLPMLAAVAACGGDGPSRLDEVKVPYETTSFGYRTIEIPGGTYTFGSDRGVLRGESLDIRDAWPRHQVQLSPFRIGMTEVTAAQYAAVMGKPHAPCKHADSAVEGEQPVCLSWDEAIQFANKASETEGLTPCYTYTPPAQECTATTKGKLMAAGVDAHTAALLDRDGTCTEWQDVGGQSVWSDRACTGYRLPTDYEWSLAAMEVVGEDEPSPPRVDVASAGWTRDDDATKGHAHQVARKAPNARGLFDTVGNLEEWTFATVNTPFHQPMPNPAQDKGRIAGRILRGGSFEWRDANVGFRQLMSALEAWPGFGVRLARSSDPEVMGRTYVAPPPAARLNGVAPVELEDDPLEHANLPSQTVEVTGGTLQVAVSVYLPRVVRISNQTDAANAAVAAYLKGRTFEQLDSWDGKLQAEHDLRGVIANAVHSSYGVSDVSFMTYVLTGQRAEPWWARAHEERHVWTQPEPVPGVPEPPPLPIGSDAPTVESLEAAIVNLNGPPLGPSPDQANAIVAAVKRNQASFHDCYMTGLRTRPDLQGKLTVAMSIRDGLASDVKVKSTTLQSATVEACAVKVFEGTRFDSSSGLIMLAYPLIFTPS